MFLNKKDLAFVTNKLQVPLIVGDILNDRASLDAEVEYGLHEVLSDFQPDSSLLAIALSAKTVIRNAQGASSSAKVLELECDRIIQEYGTIWARNAQNENVDVDQIFDVLVHTSDDLSGIADLLEANIALLRQNNNLASKLLNILQVQAKAQAMVADAFMCAAEEEIEKIEHEIPAVAFSTAALSDNVIPFPSTQVEAQTAH